MKTRTQPAVLAPRRKTIPARTRTAYHEAGHAVLSAAIANGVQHVSIRSEGDSLGRSRARPSVHPTSRVQVLLAGFAAEHLLAGRRPRQLDREVGFALVARFDPRLAAAFDGSDHHDGHRAVKEVLGMGVFESDDDTRREINRFYDIARESLSAVWGGVEAVAKAALKREELDREAVDEALAEIELFAPVFAVQQAHGLLKPTTPYGRFFAHPGQNHLPLP